MAATEEHPGVVRRKILLHSVLLLLIGCAILLASYLAVTFTGLPQWVNAVKDDMSAEELRSLGRLATDKAVFTTEVLKQTQVELSLLLSFGQLAVNGSAGNPHMKLFSGIEAQGFPSTTSQWDSSLQFDQQGLQAQGYTYACEASGCTATSYEHSNFLLPDHRPSTVAGYRTTAPFHALPNHTQNLMGKMSEVGLAMRSLRTDLEDKPQVLLYLGLEDYQPGEDTSKPAEFSVFQTFPAANMEGYRGKWINGAWKDWGAGRTCDPRWEGNWPASGRTNPRTYDPRCRGWYQDARTAGRTIFTAPYTDANTATLCVTAATPLYDAGGIFRGVVAIDFAIDALDKSILGTKILDDGYGFLMANHDSTAVIHKMLDRTGPSQTIAQLEGLTGAADFNAAEQLMRRGCTGTAEYKRDDDTWLLSYAAETAVGTDDCEAIGTPVGEGYSIALTVSEESLLKPFAELSSKIVSGVIGAAVVVSIIVGVGMLIMLKISTIIARKTTAPINNMTSLVRKLNSRTTFITVEAVNDMLSSDTDSPEMDQLIRVFRTMVNIVQASNTSLSSGEYEQALTSYQQALQLFTQMGHHAGIGICNNNIGIAYMERALAADDSEGSTATRAESFSEANNYFRLAVASARKLAQASQEPSKLVANRLFNQATCILMERNRDTITATGLRVAQEATVASKEAKKDSMRQLECHCLEAAMHALCGDTHHEATCWKQAEALFKGRSAEQACVMQQRFLTEQAKSAASLGENLRAAQLRLQALGTSPKADLETLWHAAKALENDAAIPYEMRTQGRQARTVLENAWTDLHGVAPTTAGGGSKGVRTGQHRSVVFLIDRTYHPILQPAIDAIKDIFKSTVSLDDKIALSDLSPGNWQIPLTVKRGNEKSLLDKIDNQAKIEGGASLDASIEYALETLLADPNAGKWLIVLSDMYGGNHVGGNKSRKLLQDSGVNFIFINSAEAGGWWKDRVSERAQMQRNVNAYIETGGELAQELMAGSAVELTESFHHVAAMIGSGNLKPDKL